ncbi:MAG: STAS domain-containing protein [Pirellulales bacterium]|nr:STAS domain-containing protein [Pirellulales bacterium]
MTQYERVKIEEVEITDVGTIAVVRFCGRRIRDFLEIDELGRELYGLIKQDGRRKLVLDFSGVEFFSSAAIGKLISLNGKLKLQSGVLKLCSVRPELLEVFRVCRLDQVFDIRQDRADALASFSD